MAAPRLKFIIERGRNQGYDEIEADDWRQFPRAFDRAYSVDIIMARIVNSLYEQYRFTEYTPNEFTISACDVHDSMELLLARVNGFRIESYREGDEAAEMPADGGREDNLWLDELPTALCQNPREQRFFAELAAKSQVVRRLLTLPPELVLHFFLCMLTDFVAFRDFHGDLVCPNENELHQVVCNIGTVRFHQHIKRLAIAMAGPSEGCQKYFLDFFFKRLRFEISWTPFSDSGLTLEQESLLQDWLHLIRYIRVQKKDCWAPTMAEEIDRILAFKANFPALRSLWLRSTRLPDQPMFTTGPLTTMVFTSWLPADMARVITAAAPGAWVGV